MSKLSINNKSINIFILLIIFGVFSNFNSLYAQHDTLTLDKIDLNSKILDFSTLIASNELDPLRFIEKNEAPEIDFNCNNDMLFRQELLRTVLDKYITSDSNNEFFLDFLKNDKDFNKIIARILRNNSGIIETIPFGQIPFEFNSSVEDNFNLYKEFVKKVKIQNIDYKIGYDNQYIDETISSIDSFVYNSIKIIATWFKFLLQKNNELLINIDVNKEVVNPSETGKAFISIVNNREDLSGDFVIALLDPMNNIFFYPLWSDKVQTIPVAIPGDGFTLPQIAFAEFTMPNNLPPMEKPGSYTFAAGLATTGTFDFMAIGYSDFSMNTAPDAPYIPNGYSKGWVGEQYTFKTQSLDESDHMLSIRFDWGDNLFSEWSEFLESGTTVSAHHAYLFPGIYNIRAQAQDIFGAISDWSPTHTITIINNLPPEIPTVEKLSEEGEVLKEYFFIVKTTDPDNDNVSFMVDWGDGATSEWSELVESGEEIYFSHKWGYSNTFQITVYAKDQNDAMALAPARLNMTIFKNRSPYFTHHPSGYPKGQRNIDYYFSATAIDPDGDDVSYKFNWGDGNTSDWSNFMESGTQYTESHRYLRFGVFEVTALVKDSNGNISDTSTGHIIEISSNKLPYFTSKPNGPAIGRVGIEYDFENIAKDPEGSPLSVKFMWGDGSETEWSELKNTGELFESSHIYNKAGDFRVYTLAKDSDGMISIPSQTHLIKIYGPANEAPFFTEAPFGPDKTKVGKREMFYTSAIDPDGDMIRYKFYWGDETPSDWTEYIVSGESVARDHFWDSINKYTVTVYAEDTTGKVTKNPNELEVTVEME